MSNIGSNFIFAIVFESDLAIVKEVLKDIRYCMINHFPYITEDSLFEIRLIFSELLVNAVKHGNKEEVSKKVELAIRIDNDRILAIIKDEGSGFNYLNILNRIEYAADLLSTSGRGLELVSSLTDSLNFNLCGNEIEFYKTIK